MVAALFLAAPALAGGIDCNNAATQTDMNICAGKTFQAADASLNLLYRGLMAKYDAKSQALLKDAERKWLAYRDAECAFETAPTEDGSAYPMVHALCMAALTKARVKELQAQQNCEEGDMGCNRPN